jgi:glycoprotease/Kae1 family metallohydrolase
MVIIIFVVAMLTIIRTSVGNISKLKALYPAKIMIMTVTAMTMTSLRGSTAYALRPTRLGSFIGKPLLRAVELMPAGLLNVASCSSDINDAAAISDINSKVKLKKRQSKSLAKGFSDENAHKYILADSCESGLPNSAKLYLVLGIESSCDDTGVAIVRSDGKVLSNVVHSQYSIHHKFGGVVPMLAMKAHKENIDEAVKQAMDEAGITTIDEIDAIAVTKGPGLQVCLDIGYQKAKRLALKHQKPFAAVHHLEAHCLIARLAGQDFLASETPPMNACELSGSGPVVDYPFLTFLASGGHTSLLLTTGLGQHTVLGGTYDDALGEAFDKAARQLGLPLESSGGVAVERAASRAQARYSENNLKPKLFEDCFSVPMRDKRNCDFSYSGTLAANKFH